MEKPMTKLGDEKQLSAYRDKLTAAYDPNKTRICVCNGTGCNAQGSEDLVQALKDAVAQKGLIEKVEVKATGCHGFCEKGPIVVVRPENTFQVLVKPEDAEELVQKTCVEGTHVDRLVYIDPASAEPVYKEQDVPFYKKQTRVILADNGHLDPTSIDDYITHGGYAALARALTAMTPDEVISEVKSAGLRGRGGAGFPAARKWELCRQQPGDQKYIICNADEGDPGAYMNRSEIEGNPHLMLEGMIIGAYAIGASKGYIYCRAEYPLAIAQLEKALSSARKKGLLGSNILNSGFGLDITIKMGAGAFVCGEETALIHSIEGKRGMPRPRPPYPAQRGLFGKPTNINNVETWCNVPLIIDRGADWYAGIGNATSKGTKVFSLVGSVNNTGLVEVPFGTSLREIVEDIGGGVPAGKKFKAAQMGGPSGGCIPASQMDVNIDYESLQSLGAIVGSGGLVVLDESTCMVDLAKYFMEFIQSESCGKCIPCREGTRRMLEILEAMTRGRRNETDNDALIRFQGVLELEQLAKVILDTSLCGLGQTAANPVLSTLRWFREEYEAHIYDRRCPAGTCKELVGAPCETGCPVGTEAWRYIAHVSRDELPEAYRAIRQHNPFPSACARVCHHPCETVCRCGTTGGEAIAIRALKRYVVENVPSSTFRTEIKAPGANAKRIAVVGAGPAGLTAAHCLSAKGHRVTIFEKEKVPGGMLVCAIPEYRLPRETLSQEISALLNDNIELRTGKALGSDFSVDDLFADGYDAIYLALGAHRSKRLGIENEDTPGVLPGMEFLKAYNLHGNALAKGHVGVIGGGNSAIDAARIALRQPGVTSVTVFYRRSEAEMPAHIDEITDAREEGIVIRELVTPVAAIADNGTLKAVRFIANALGRPDAQGRRRPVPIEGSEFEVPLDTLIAAISEDPDTACLNNAVALTKWDSIKTNPESHLTNRPGVFAGGDVVTGPNMIIAAVADGQNAAEMIDRFCLGKKLRKIDHVKLPTVYVEPVPVCDVENSTTRVRLPHLPLAERKGNFNEVELVLTPDMAICEARRCLRCDLDFTQPA